MHSMWPILNGRHYNDRMISNQEYTLSTKISHVFFSLVWISISNHNIFNRCFKFQPSFFIQNNTTFTKAFFARVFLQKSFARVFLLNFFTRIFLSIFSPKFFFQFFRPSFSFLFFFANVFFPFFCQCSFFFPTVFFFICEMFFQVTASFRRKETIFMVPCEK